MLRIKQIIVAVLYVIFAKTAELLFPKEIAAEQQKIKDNLEAINKNKEQIRNSIKNHYDGLTDETEKERIVRFSRLQRPLLEAYMTFTKEIQEVDGVEMENVRDFWLAMVGGLNKTMTVPFALDTDFEIKNYFNQMDREMELILNADVELEDSSDPRGPVGNA